MGNLNYMKIAFIEWEDSVTTYGWQQPTAGEKPSTIHSVGIIVDQYKAAVTISTSKSQAGRSLDYLTIPRSAIRRMSVADYKIRSK
jgi:hypothetical protein